MLSLTTIYVKAEMGLTRTDRPKHSMGASLRSRRTVATLMRRPELKGRDAALPNQTAKLELGELNGHLGYCLRRLQVAVFQDFMRTLAPMELRPAQYSVLILIAANPGRSQAAIGKALKIERAALARMLHELEGRKWVERRLTDGDGRSHSLVLTSKGEKALGRIKRLTARHEAHIASLVGPTRRMQLMDLLRDFR
jgi:DNA-binding MarR family transcriptional regulator